MRGIRRGVVAAACLAAAALLPLQPPAARAGGPAGSAVTSPATYEELRKGVVDRFGTVRPREWGETATGVKTRLDTGEKVIALTLDACGSRTGMGFDARLLEFLQREGVPATLFINVRWIGPNRESFDRLAADPLFEIANHGYLHRPASVTGRSAYGINGTRDVAELVDEIELNARKIEELTGRRPRFYRSGTAYYDEVAVRVAEALGHQVAGYSVLGDAGATYRRDEVTKALLSSPPGAIVILHMNHPESGTGPGVMAAVPELKRRGYRFVRLSDLPLK